MERIMAQDDSCRIRIVRGSKFADYLRHYQILINGAVVGAVGSGGVLELEIPAGPLTIEAKVDWGRSRPLTIEAAPRQRIEIEVTNNWGALLSLWTITFGKNSYLKLTPLRTAA
jgi:hypothetical protein